MALEQFGTGKRPSKIGLTKELMNERFRTLCQELWQQDVPPGVSDSEVSLLRSMFQSGFIAGTNFACEALDRRGTQR